jgi:hypothetical protein
LPLVGVIRLLVYDTLIDALCSSDN